MGLKSPERSNPALPTSHINLMFDGDFLHIRCAATTVLKYSAVSGLPPFDCSPNGQALQTRVRSQRALTG